MDDTDRPDPSDDPPGHLSDAPLDVLFGPRGRPIGGDGASAPRPPAPGRR